MNSTDSYRSKAKMSEDYSFGWYEYERSKQEEAEIYALQMRKKNAIDKLLTSLNLRDYNTICMLNADVRDTEKKFYTSPTKVTEDAYNSALKVFNKFTEQWPILKNGF
jgi:hypothetical protein